MEINSVNKTVFDELRHTESTKPNPYFPKYLDKPAPTDSFELSGKKDDGKIGFISAAKNVIKGAGKFFTNMFCDKNGDFSIKQTLKTVGFGAALAAASFIPVVGPLVIPIVCGYGMFDGAMNILKGVGNAMVAKTDKEAEQAWQEVGMGTTEGVVSYIGYKATGGINKAIDKSASQLTAVQKQKALSTAETAPSSEVLNTNEVKPAANETEVLVVDKNTVAEEVSAPIKQELAEVPADKPSVAEVQPKVKQEVVETDAPSKTEANASSDSVPNQEMELKPIDFGKEEPSVKVPEIEGAKTSELSTKPKNELQTPKKQKEKKIDPKTVKKVVEFVKEVKEQLDDAKKLAEDVKDALKEEEGLTSAEETAAERQNIAEEIFGEKPKIAEEPVTEEVVSDIPEFNSAEYKIPSEEYSELYPEHEMLYDNPQYNTIEDYPGYTTDCNPIVDEFGTTEFGYGEDGGFV